MLKHTQLLDKMSAKQKISLVANIRCLADEEYVALGLPHVKFVTLDELFLKDGDGLTPYTLARSWDLEHIRQVTEQIIQRNCEDANVIVVPSPKINLGGEAQLALSEDPFLATQIALAFLSAVNHCGKTGIIPDFFLTAREVANMDIQPNANALRSFIYEPFSAMVKNGKAKAVLCSLSKNAGAYEEFNCSLIRSKEKYFSAETQLLCTCRTYDETLAALDENCIIFSGVEIAIQNAYDAYQNILSSIEKGHASMIALEEAIEQKTAISDQMLDAAAEKVIDFAYRMNHIDPETICYTPKAEEAATEESSATANATLTEETAPTAEETPTVVTDVSSSEQPQEESEAVPVKTQADEKFITHAIEKSTVLLKNKNNVLPLVRSKTYAIIGDAALLISQGDTTSFAEYFKQLAPNQCVGIERGYDMLEDRSDALIAPAVALAKKASTVFVFLKPRENKNASYPCTSLPANQTALMGALSKCNCNVVAILCSDTNVDVSFNIYADGLLLAPIAGKLSASALVNILFKKVAPGGKLTTTFYISPSKFFKRQRFYKDTGRNKVGIFVGYRFYDTQNIPLRYPFGFGLQYSNVEISDVTWTSSSLTFTVRNPGQTEINETFQVYTGLKTSKLLRPNKELKAFRSLHLSPGMSEHITIKNIDLSVYNVATNVTVTESGDYTLFLGTSVSHIKTKTSSNVSGKTLTQKAPVLSEYLQAKTNITSNNFTLEAKHTKMANYKGYKNAGFICLLIAVVVALMSTSVEPMYVPLIIGGVFLLTSSILFIVSDKIKRRIKSEEAKLVEQNKKLFQTAETAATDKLDDLFLKEFKFDVADSASVQEEVEETYVDTATAMLNDNMSFAIAAEDVKKSAEEAGITMDAQCASTLVAALVSSKFILAKTTENEGFDAFVAALAGYFHANLFTETITPAHNPSDRLLRVTNENGESASTAVLSALLSAEEKPQVMHFIHLKNLPVAQISDYLIPYIKYFSNPHAGAEISVKGSDELYTIPSNVWFIAELEKGSLVENVPAYVLEYATVLPVKFAQCPPTEMKSEFVPITLTDFEFLSERCKAQFALNEDIWKKMDTLEAFVSKPTSYTIGNKLWLRIETYLSTLLSTGTELPVAIDSALASVILPTLASALTGKIKDGDKTLVDEVERVFGEDNVQISHEMLVSKA